MTNNILQLSRNEIIELISVDIQNDLKTCIEVAGNYVATSYDVYDETAELIKTKITDKELKTSKTLNWFIDVITIYK